FTRTCGSLAAGSTAVSAVLFPLSALSAAIGALTALSVLSAAIGALTALSVLSAAVGVLSALTVLSVLSTAVERVFAPAVAVSLLAWARWMSARTRSGVSSHHSRLGFRLRAFWQQSLARVRLPSCSALRACCRSWRAFSVLPLSLPGSGVAAAVPSGLLV